MFHSYAGKAVSDIVVKKLLPSGGSVVEMGNQTYAVRGETVRRITSALRAARIPDAAVDYEALEKFESAHAASHPGDPKAPLTADFYKALGFKSYTAIDISDRFGSLVMDLNCDLREAYGFTEQFDLVTNIGVSEHLFDQAAFFKNAHQLVKPGGLMLHILPSVTYVNHGFFNYNPVLFVDLAHENDYELLQMNLADFRTATSVLDAMHPNEVGTFFSHYAAQLAPHLFGNLDLAVLMRKREERPFALPLQGKYLSDIARDDLKSVYGAGGQSPIPISRKGYFSVTEAVPMSGAARVRRALQRAALKALMRASRFVLGFSSSGAQGQS